MKRVKLISKRGWPLMAMVTVLSFASCGKKAPPQAPPPPPVTVMMPDFREATVYAEHPATLEAISLNEVRARVAGVLTEQFFTDGELVKKGEPLFQIEPEPFEQALNAAKADVSRAVAGQELAQKRFDRFSSALESKAISEIDVEIASAELAQAMASVQQSKAKLQNAEINLGYTKLLSPVDGRVSRAFVSIGNLVGYSEPTLLTTVIDDSKIYAYFEVPERRMLDYFSARADQDVASILKSLEIRLTLADGRVYKHTGRIDFLDNEVDARTRTNKVRAVFENPDAEIAAGLYGMVGVPVRPDPTQPDKTKAYVLPSESILRDLAGSFVWVVGEGGVVQRRGVKVGKNLPLNATEGKKMSVILDGVDGSESVIVAGLQRAREGAVVSPQERKPAVTTEGQAPKD